MQCRMLGRVAVLLWVASVASAASSVAFARLPEGASLGEAKGELSMDDLLTLNRHLMGLTATKPEALPSLTSGSLLSRPEALVLLTSTAPLSAPSALGLSGGSAPALRRHSVAAMDGLNVIDLDAGDKALKDGRPDLLLKSVKDEQEAASVVASLEAVYGAGRVLAEVVHLPGRAKRQADAAAPAKGHGTPPSAKNNPNQVYLFSSGDYSAAFHIILFAGLVIGLSVLFIACGMWEMDPGKDSIIYRMTMTRAKKD